MKFALVPTVLATWTAHPAKSRPRDVALVVAVWAVTTAVVLATFESFFLGALATVILGVACAPFLLPTRYTVTDDGIESRRAFTVRARRFADLRRVEEWRHAILVSPFKEPSFLDTQRGIVLYLDGADRKKIVSLLKEKIAGDPT